MRRCRTQEHADEQHVGSQDERHLDTLGVRKRSWREVATSATDRIVNFSSGTSIRSAKGACSALAATAARTLCSAGSVNPTATKSSSTSSVIF